MKALLGRKPWDIPPGCQGCRGAGPFYARGARPRRRWGKGVLAFVTLCNLALSLALAVLRRQEVIHAVRTADGEGARVLVESRKETKS